MANQNTNPYQAPQVLSSDGKPPSQIRVISGFIVLVFGIALTLQMMRLVYFYGHEFSDVEWNRFRVLLGFGFWLTVIGCWLVWRSRIAGWLSLLPFALLIFGIFAALFNDIFF